jgi:hypothetical protein
MRPTSSARSRAGRLLLVTATNSWPVASSESLMATLGEPHLGHAPSTGGRVLTPYWGFKGRQWEKVAPFSRRKTRRG